MMRAAFGVLIALTFVAVPVAAEEPKVPGPPALVIAAQQYLPSGTVTTFRETETIVLWTIEVRRGDVVLVRNLDPLIPSFQHTVTSCVSPCRTLAPDTIPTQSGAFDTGVIPHTGGGASFDTASLTPGTYEFFCKPHPWMRGAIAVA